jgi:hypothetical protein
MLSLETYEMKPKIDPLVEKLIEELSPAVRYIRYEVKPDWNGDPAVLFRVVLSDKATRTKASRRDVTRRVKDQIMERIFLPDLGVFPHFDFRSESEQAKRKDPDWDVR